MDSGILQPVVLLLLVGLEGHDQLRHRAVVPKHLLVDRRVDFGRHLAAVDQDPNDDALQELLDQRPGRDPGVDELFDVFARHVVSREPEGRERMCPVLLPDVVGQLAHDFSEVPEDEAEFGDLFLQGRAREPPVLHSFVDGGHHAERCHRGVETEVVLNAGSVPHLGRVQQAEERRLP